MTGRWLPIPYFGGTGGQIARALTPSRHRVGERVSSLRIGSLFSGYGGGR